MNRDNQIDAFIPPEMAERAEEIGVKKTNMPIATMFVLAVLAGAFIALGSVFSTVATTGGQDQLPFGVVKLIGGLTFSLGLILVVVAGAELFTGNNLQVMALCRGRISSIQLLRCWGVVFIGNFVGAIATAGIVFMSGSHLHGQSAVGLNALNIAVTKCSLDFGQAIFLGVLCNALVCLAVWLCYSARSTTDKVMSIVFPITAFVAAGFEHCVANMYMIPYAIFIKTFAGAEFWAAGTVRSGDFEMITWNSFLLSNLLPVTIGNIIGGAIMVGLVYWFVYLRSHSGT